MTSLTFDNYDKLNYLFKMELFFRFETYIKVTINMWDKDYKVPHKFLLQTSILLCFFFLELGLFSFSGDTLLLLIGELRLFVSTIHFGAACFILFLKNSRSNVK